MTQTRELTTSSYSQKKKHENTVRYVTAENSLVLEAL